MNDDFTVSVDVDKDSIVEYLEDMEVSMQNIEEFISSDDDLLVKIDDIKAEYEQLSLASIKLSLVSISECIDDVVKVCKVFSQYSFFPVKASELLLLIGDKISNITQNVAEKMQIDMMETQNITVSLQNIVLAKDEQQCKEAVNKSLELLTEHINANSEPDVLDDDINDLFLDFFDEDENTEEIEFFDEPEPDSNHHEQQAGSDKEAEASPPQQEIQDSNTIDAPLQEKKQCSDTIEATPQIEAEIIVPQNNPLDLAKEIMTELNNAVVYDLLAKISDKNSIHGDPHTKVLLEIVLAMNHLAGSPMDPDSLAKGICLHDIGLAHLADILNLQRKLSDEEFAFIEEHPLKGAAVAEALSLDECAVNAVLQHHERLDGSGYPYGIKADEISDAGKILSIADSFHAMIHYRPHKKYTRSALRAINEINACVDTHYDRFWVKQFNMLMLKYWLPVNKNIYKTLKKLPEKFTY